MSVFFTIASTARGMHAPPSSRGRSVSGSAPPVSGSEPGRDDVRDHDRDDHDRRQLQRRPPRGRASRAARRRAAGRAWRPVIAPMPIAAPATIGRPGRCESAMPPTAPMNMPGKTGPPRKPLKRDGVGEPLAEDEQEQRPDRPGRRPPRSAGRAGPAPRRGRWRRTLVGRLDEDQCEHADRDARERRQKEAPPRDDRLEPQRELADAGADERRQDADRDRPEELGAGRAADRRECRARASENVPNPVQSFEPDEDERADARRPAGPARARRPSARRRARRPPSSETRPRAASRAGSRSRRSSLPHRSRRSPSRARRA